MANFRTHVAQRSDRAPVLSHSEIRERAYDLWDRHHRPDGYELEFWFMAERELKAERGNTSIGLPEAERT